jgi:hypothetical protein
MQLVNPLGQVVLDQMLVRELGLNEFRPGMYIVKVYDPATNRSLHRKLVITE